MMERPMQDPLLEAIAVFSLVAVGAIGAGIALFVVGSEMDARVKGRWDLGLLVVMVAGGGGAGRRVRAQRRLSL